MNSFLMFTNFKTKKTEPVAKITKGKTKSQRQTSKGYLYVRGPDTTWPVEYITKHICHSPQLNVENILQVLIKFFLLSKTTLYNMK